MQPEPTSVQSSPGMSEMQMGVPLQVQHEAAEPQTAAPHWLPWFSWQVPLTTHV
jgi:hypothetical protein